MKMHRTFMTGNMSDAEKRLVFDASVPSQSPEETAQLRARVEELEAELKTKEQVIEAQQKALMQIDTMSRQLELRQQQLAELELRADSDSVDSPRRIAVRSISRRQGEYPQVLPERYEFRTRTNRSRTPIRIEEPHIDELPSKTRRKEPPYEGKIRTQYIKDPRNPKAMGRMVRQEYKNGEWVEIGVIHSQEDMQANAERIRLEREQQIVTAQNNARILREWNASGRDTARYQAREDHARGLAAMGWREGQTERVPEPNIPQYTYVDPRGTSQNYAQDTYERYKEPSQPRAEGPDWMHYESGTEDLRAGFASVNGTILRVPEGSQYSGKNVHLDDDVQYKGMVQQDKAILFTQQLQGTLSGKRIGAVDRKPAEGASSLTVEGTNEEIHIACPNNHKIVMKTGMTPEEKKSLQQQLVEQGLIIQLFESLPGLRNGWSVQILPTKPGTWTIQKVGENGRPMQTSMLVSSKNGTENESFTSEEITNFESKIKIFDEQGINPGFSDKELFIIRQNYETGVDNKSQNEGTSSTVSAVPIRTVSMNKVRNVSPVAFGEKQAEVDKRETIGIGSAIGDIDANRIEVSAQEVVGYMGVLFIEPPDVQSDLQKRIAIDMRSPKTREQMRVQIDQLKEQGLVVEFLQPDIGTLGNWKLRVTPTKAGEWHLWKKDVMDRSKDVAILKTTNEAAEYFPDADNSVA